MSINWRSILATEFGWVGCCLWQTLYKRKHCRLSNSLCKWKTSCKRAGGSEPCELSLISLTWKLAWELNCNKNRWCEHLWLGRCMCVIRSYCSGKCFLKWQVGLMQVARSSCFPVSKVQCSSPIFLHYFLFSVVHCRRRLILLPSA